MRTDVMRKVVELAGAARGRDKEAVGVAAESRKVRGETRQGCARGGGWLRCRRAPREEEERRWRGLAKRDE